MSGCGKYTFASKRDAKKFVRDESSKNAGNLNPYKCTRCEYWHLTRMKGPAMRNLSKKRERLILKNKGLAL